MLNEFRTQRIVWDRANSRLFEPVNAVEGDENGRRLEVQIVNGGTVENLSGVSLTLAWRNNSATGLESFEIVNADEGVFELYYPTGMLKNVGKLKASLVLFDNGGKLESREFEIYIQRSVLDSEAVESSNEFTALTSVLVGINGFNARLEQTVKEVNRKRELEDLSPTVLAAIEGGENTTFNLLSIPQDRSVSEIKTTFMEVADEKDETVNLIPNVLGELGVYYDPASGNPVKTDFTMVYKATGKITKGDFATMKSFGVQSWIFFTSENSRISAQELNPSVVTEVAFPTDTAYVIGNIQDRYFPVDDPDRSTIPIGVATATVTKTNLKYNIKDLIIEDENLSEEIKAAIEVSGGDNIYVGEKNTENKPLWIDTSDLVKGFVPVPPTDYVPDGYEPPTNPEDPPVEGVVVFDSREEELNFQQNPTTVYLSSFEVFLDPNREYAFYTNFGGRMPGDLWVSNNNYVPQQEPVVDGTATIVTNPNGSFVITGRVETHPDTGQANEYSVAHFIDKTYYFTIMEVD